MDETTLTMASWTQAVAAVGTLLVAVIAAYFALREHRNTREAFVQQMRMEWQRLAPSWALILMAENGGDYHYADANFEERIRGERLHRTVGSGDETELEYSNVGTLNGLLKSITNTIEYSVMTIRHGRINAQLLKSGEDYNGALELRSQVRPVTRFFGYAADSVLRGRWRMSEAYDVFGLDVARHHKIIRELAHRGEWTKSNNWLLQSTEFNNFDEQDCVYLFAFLIRAEQCRRGDTYGHFTAELAGEMRGEYRSNIRACINRTKRVRHRLYLPIRVSMLFWRGRHPRLASAYLGPEEPIITGTERRLFRRPFEPITLLRFRIWWSTQRGKPENNGIFEVMKELPKTLVNRWINF